MGMHSEDRLLSYGLWPEVKKLRKIAEPIMAAIAYYSDDKLSLRPGDLLVVDASDRVVKSGATRGALLLALVNAGVEVRSLPGLHAKVLAIGGHAVVGSANASRNSEEHLTEAALLTSSSAVLAQVITLIEGLARNAKVLDQSEAERLASLEVTQSPMLDTKPLQIALDNSTCWWVATGPVSARHERLEAAAIDQGKQEANEAVGYGDWASDVIRYPTSSRWASKLKLNDRVVQVYSEPYGDEASAKVFCPATIVHVQEGPGWVRFHLKSLLGDWKTKSLKESQLALARLRIRVPCVKSTLQLDSKAFSALDDVFAET